MNNLNILIVDDLPANILSIRALIEEENIIIHEAFSGEEALKKVLLEEVDLILLDVQMPKMTGFEVAEILRSNPKTSSIPIIFVTAIDRNDKLSFKGYQLGAVDFLYKPIQRVLLKSKVAVFMNLIFVQKELQEKNNLLEKINDELKEAERDLMQMANTDSLTGISNRRSLFESVDKSWRVCLRDKSEISFIMIDIDDFKMFNDSFGHIEGDRTLIDVSSTIKKTLTRPYDEVGRYGGEEFMVVLPKTNHAGALQVAEKVRKNILDLKIPHSMESPHEFVTISLGVSTFIPIMKKNYEEIIDVADEALFVSKESGKNKVTGKNLTIE